jgi:glycosyltransferase involved in cell wall biosynthesis
MGNVNKILIATAFPIYGAGSGILVNLQSAYHRMHNKQVHIITANNRDDFEKRDDIGYTVVPFTSQVPGAPVLEGAAPFNYLMFTTHTESTENFWNIGLKELEIYNDTFKRTLDKVIAEFNPDVIHAQHNWLLSSMCTRYNLPVVTTVHGTDLIGYEKSLDYLEKINKELETNPNDQKLLEEKQKYEFYISEAENSARNSDKIIIISDAQMEKFLKLFPFAKDHAVLAENGYDERVYHYDESEKSTDIIDQLNEKVRNGLENGTIDVGENKELNVSKFGNIPKDSDYYGLFVGKFADFKGIDALLMAMKKYTDFMKEKGKTITSIIVGSGKLNDNYMKLYDKLGLENVRFTGKTTSDEIHKLQLLSEFKFVPSREEPFGLVVPEGVADGIPVIGSNSGGIPSILKGDMEDLPDSDIIKTPLGILFKSLPKRLNNIADAEHEELLALDLLTADYIFDESKKQDSINQVSQMFNISENEAKEYLDNYERSVNAIAESAEKILTREIVFDKSTLAHLIAEKYGQNKKEEQILQIFEDAYNEHNK